MLSISLVDNRTLLIEGRLQRTYELLFSLAGKPVAFRIKSPHTELVHKLSGARIPKEWRENSQLEEHSETEFQSKLIAFIHIAGDS